MSKIETLENMITYLQSKVNIQETHIVELNTRIAELEKVNKISNVEIV